MEEALARVVLPVTPNVPEMVVVAKPELPDITELPVVVALPDTIWLP